MLCKTRELFVYEVLFKWRKKGDVGADMPWLIGECRLRDEVGKFSDREISLDCYNTRISTFTTSIDAGWGKDARVI